MPSITAVCLLFIAVLAGCSFQREQMEKEVLLVWGQQGDDYDSPCSVWLVDPAQKLSVKVLAEANTCWFNVVDIDNVPHLIYREKPGEITIYQINAANKILSFQKTITLPITEPFSLPQWGKDGHIYFSSTLREGIEQVYREQIFRMDGETETVEPFIRHDAGLAADPIMSPDGRFLVYWTVDGPANRNERPDCPTGCGVGYYHVFDLEEEKDIPLLPFVQQIRDERLALSHHENATWSPTGQFLAFQLSVRGAGGIVIFDARNKKIVADIPSDSARDTRIIQWASDTELIYLANRYSPELGHEFGRPFAYSLDNQTAQELLPDLTLENENEQPYYFYEIYTPLNRNQMVGIISGLVEGVTVSLFAVDLDQSPATLDILFSDNELPNILSRGNRFQKLVGSVSGEWLAYQAIYLITEGDSSRIYHADLLVMDMAGQLVPVEEGITGVLSDTVGYVWVQVRSQ